MLFIFHFVFATALAYSSVGVYSLPLRETPGGSESVWQLQRFDRRSTNEPQATGSSKRSRDRSHTALYEQLVADGFTDIEEVKKAGRQPSNVKDVQLKSGLAYQVAKLAKQAQKSADHVPGSHDYTALFRTLYDAGKRTARAARDSGLIPENSKVTDRQLTSGFQAQRRRVAKAQKKAGGSSDPPLKKKRKTDPPPQGSQVPGSHHEAPTASTSQHQSSYTADGASSVHHASQVSDNGPATHHDAPTASTSQSEGGKGKAPERHPAVPAAETIAPGPAAQATISKDSKRKLRELAFLADELPRAGTDPAPKNSQPRPPHAMEGLDMLVEEALKKSQGK